MKARLRPQRHCQEHPKRPKSIAKLSPDTWVLISVPALVDEALFEAVQVQLQENRQRARQGKRGARYLLQGLLVCAQCRYAYYGKAISNKAARGKKRDYAYYRCIGSDAYRFGGERICDNLQVRTDRLDQYAWEEVCALLREPVRLSQEYQRRLRTPDGQQQSLQVLQTQIARRHKSIARLIDSYTEGYLEKQEFEPRIRRLRQRLNDLETQAKQKIYEQAQQAELQQVITRLEEFSAKVKDNLEEADWLTKRDLIRTLVKQVEVGKEDVTIVFRVIPDPFVVDPDRSGLPSNQGSLQHCWGRSNPALRRTGIGRGKAARFHHSRLQHFADEVDETLVFDALSQTVQDNSVRNTPETICDVAFDDPLCPGAIGTCHLPKRGDGTVLCSKSV
jgi:site-specific DNA recombinase